MITLSKLNNHHFFPSQPEIESKMDHYIELKPTKHASSKNIALYYQFRTQKDAVNSFSIIPDGCFDIMFCCSSSKQSAVFWTSPLHRSMKSELQNECEYFGVRFVPEQRVIKLKYSMRDLLGKIIPLADIMSGDSFILEKIGDVDSFEKRIQIFELFMDSMNCELNYDQNIVGFSIKQIYASKGLINIEQLSKDTGYSDRYLRNKFEEFIGFSPKQFTQIVRFQNSLAMLLKTDNYNLLDIVHENGYHDQSHFIKGFKKFVHLTPIQFKENVSKNLNFLYFDEADCDFLF